MRIVFILATGYTLVQVHACDISKLCMHRIHRHTFGVILVGFATDLLVLQLQAASLIVINLGIWFMVLSPYMTRRSSLVAIEYRLSLGKIKVKHRHCIFLLFFNCHQQV